MFLDAIRCEIIPIHIGNPNHRHFVRTTPTKNEDHLRASGLIPITRSQSKQTTLIPPTLIPPSTLSEQIKNEINQNFEYSKRIGVPAKRSTYTQNSRNMIDHSSYPQANSNYYEREKQRVFNQDEMANYQPNGYQSGGYQAASPVHQPPSNLGYIPSNANNYDYHRASQYDYGGRTPNSPYGNNAVMHNHYGNQPYDQQREHQDYQANNNDVGLDRELNDIGLDGSLYDMPFNQDLDNGGHLFNDAMNFDIPNFY